MSDNTKIKIITCPGCGSQDTDIETWKAASGLFGFAISDIISLDCNHCGRTYAKYEYSDIWTLIVHAPEGVM